MGDEVLPDSSARLRRLAEESGQEALVEMYEVLTDFGESDIVNAHVPAGAEILEVGCGTGRMTRRLLELGHLVTGVDVSEVMLGHVPPEAIKVLADIETLDLGRTFPVVLLASTMINTPDDASRHRLLASCRRHLSKDGQVIVERRPPEFERDSDEWERFGVIEVRTASLERRGNKVTRTVEYRAGERLWSTSFTQVTLDDAALQAAASRTNLTLNRRLTPDGRWVELCPASADN